MLLDSLSLRGKEVLESILFNKVILVVDGQVLHLLFGLNQMLVLGLLNHVIPGGEELGQLVLGVGVVPVGELGSNYKGEVASLNQSQVEAEDVLVVEDHTTNPLVVGPSAKSGKRSDRSNVEEEEDKTASTLRQSLVVRGNLLWPDSLVQNAQVVEVGEDEWVGVAVVGVGVSCLHVLQFVGIVGLSILFLVLGLSPATINQLVNALSCLESFVLTWRVQT